MKNLKASSKIEGVGILKEITVNFTKKNDCIMVKSKLVLNINGNYFYCIFNTTNKNFNRYYNLIKFLGLPYKYIESIDEQTYTLSNPILQCPFGNVNINNKKILNLSKDKETYVQFNGQLITDKMISIKFMTIEEKQDSYIDCIIKGICCKKQLLLIHNEDYVQMLDIHHKDMIDNKTYECKLNIGGGDVIDGNIVKKTNSSFMYIDEIKEIENDITEKIISTYEHKWRVYQMKNKIDKH